MTEWDALVLAGIDAPPAVDLRAYWSGEGAGLPPTYDMALQLGLHHLGERPDEIVDVGCNSGRSVIEAVGRMGLHGVPIQGLDILPHDYATYYLPAGIDTSYFTYTQVDQHQPLTAYLERHDPPYRRLVLGLNVLYRANDQSNMGGSELLHKIHDIEHPGDISVFSSALPGHAQARHWLARQALWDVAHEYRIPSAGIRSPAHSLCLAALHQILADMPGFEIVETAERHGSTVITPERLEPFLITTMNEFYRTDLPETAAMFAAYRAAIRRRGMALNQRLRDKGIHIRDAVHTGMVVVRRIGEIAC